MLNTERGTGFEPRPKRFAGAVIPEPRRNAANGATCPVRQYKNHNETIQQRGTGFEPRPKRFAGAVIPEPRRNAANGATCPVRQYKNHNETIQPFTGLGGFLLCVVGAAKRPNAGRGLNPVPTVLLAPLSLNHAETLRTGQHAPSGYLALSGNLRSLRHSF